MKDFTAENFAVADFYQKYNQELFSITDHKDDILEFKTYGNEFLIIKKENGEYAFFETKNINHMKFDTDLLNVCKYMIEKGNFSYFEYASEYLKIYDFQFIEKYIKRYSQGNFYDYEIENKYNDGIKLSYVKNLAQKQLVDE